MRFLRLMNDHGGLRDGVEVYIRFWKSQEDFSAPSDIHK